MCDEIGLKPVALKKFCPTRFRTFRNCICPVLHNWDGIVRYYRQVKKPTERQKLLVEYFVTREEMNLLKLNFMYSTMKDLVDGIDFFEQRTELVHVSRGRMEDLLRGQLLKFHKDTVVKNVDSDLNTCSKKFGPQLLKIDVEDKDTILSKKSVFIGQEATKLIKEMGLKPDSLQLNWFFEAVFKYHKMVTKKLIGYFETGLNSTDLDYMSALDARNRNNISTSHKLKYLASSFSKVLDNINPSNGRDIVKTEIEQYVMDDDLEENKNETVDLKFEEYWDMVGDLKEGEWKRYEILPRLAKAVGTIFNSNSETERAFSVQSDIHRNEKKNKMSQIRLDSHMQIHYGVESKSNKMSCEKCEKNKNKKSPDPYCHCSIAHTFLRR